LTKAIARNPSERYESVESFANDLSRFANDLPVQARRPTTSYLLGKFLLRNKAASLFSLAAVLLLILGFLASRYQVRITREAHQRSEALRRNLVVAQRQTQALLEAADLRLTAEAISGGDRLES